MKNVKNIIIIFMAAFYQVVSCQSSNYSLEDKILEEIETNSIRSLLVNEFTSFRIKFNSNSHMNNIVHLYEQGEQNQSMILQNGAENLALLYRKGDYNIDNTKQNGDNNSYNSTLLGDGNNNNIDQNGNNNSIDQTLIGNGMDINISQSGSNHELKQVETDGNTSGYTIRQRGSGMKITITNGNQLP